MPAKIPGFILNISHFENCCHVQQMKDEFVPQLPIGLKINFPDGESMHFMFKGENATKEALEEFIDSLHAKAVEWKEEDSGSGE